MSSYIRRVKTENYCKWKETPIVDCIPAIFACNMVPTYVFKKRHKAAQPPKDSAVVGEDGDREASNKKQEAGVRIWRHFVR